MFQLLTKVGKQLGVGNAAVWWKEQDWHRDSPEGWSRAEHPLSCDQDSVTACTEPEPLSPDVILECSSGRVQCVLSLKESCW